MFQPIAQATLPPYGEKSNSERFVGARVRIALARRRARRFAILSDGESSHALPLAEAPNARCPLLRVAAPVEWFGSWRSGEARQYAALQSPGRPKVPPGEQIDAVPFRGGCWCFAGPDNRRETGSPMPPSLDEMTMDRCAHQCYPISQTETRALERMKSSPFLSRTAQRGDRACRSPLVIRGP
jgi:hypothetical protein